MNALGYVVSLLALSASAPALAEETAPAPTYALSWVRAEGAEACPPAAVLASEVEHRLGRAVFDVKAERSIEVDVTRFGDRYRSDVYVRDASGRALGHRQLESDEPGCGALLSATALAIALVIDPDAASRAPVAAPASASFEAPSEAAPPPPPAPPPVPLTRLETGPVQPRPTRLEAPSRRMAFADVALSATDNLGLVPRAAPGVQLAVSARAGGRWGFALSADYVPSETATRGVGSLEVGLTRDSALLVYYFTARPQDVRFWLGLGPTLGAFHVGVRRPAPVTDTGDFWFGAAEARASLGLRLYKGIFAHAALSAVVAPWRQEYWVRGESDAVWRQPALAASGALGLGTTFP